MSRFVDENEVLLYCVRKSIGPIIFMFVFMPIWLYFGFLFLTPCFQALFSGAPASIPMDHYLAGLIGLVVFRPVACIILLSYLLNQLVITNQRIYIRKGIAGKISILNLDDIRSFQHIYAGKNRSNNAIQFYLLCGKSVKTGNLYATMKSLQEVLALLREKYEGRGFTNQELKQMELQNTKGCQILTKTNGFALCLLLMPFLLALILSILYLM